MDLLHARERSAEDLYWREFMNAQILSGKAVFTSNATRPQHNLMQKSAQTVDAQNGSAQGKPLCVTSINAQNAKQMH